MLVAQSHAADPRRGRPEGGIPSAAPRGAPAPGRDSAKRLARQTGAPSLMTRATTSATADRATVVLPDPARTHIVRKTAPASCVVRAAMIWSRPTMRVSGTDGLLAAGARSGGAGAASAHSGASPVRQRVTSAGVCWRHSGLPARPPSRAPLRRPRHGPEGTSSTIVSGPGAGDKLLLRGSSRRPRSTSGNQNGRAARTARRSRRLSVEQDPLAGSSPTIQKQRSRYPPGEPS